MAACCTITHRSTSPTRQKCSGGSQREALDFPVVGDGPQRAAFEGNIENLGSYREAADDDTRAGLVALSWLEEAPAWVLVGLSPCPGRSMEDEPSYHAPVISHFRGEGSNELTTKCFATPAGPQTRYPRCSSSPAILRAPPVIMRLRNSSMSPHGFMKPPW